MVAHKLPTTDVMLLLSNININKYIHQFWNFKHIPNCGWTGIKWHKRHEKKIWVNQSKIVKRIVIIKKILIDALPA